MDKLNENAYFVTRYLRDELGFGDNVTSPEFYHIEDPSSGKPFSTRYFGIWSYTPVLKSKKRIYIVNSVASALIAGIVGGLTVLTFFML